MSYKDKKWDDVETSYLKTFDKEVPVFSPSTYFDVRGEIFTTFHSQLHPVTKFVSGNTQGRFSKSYKNALRGLHYDNKTWKLVQALVGDIYLIVLDIREQSSTYGKWESYVISERNRHQVLIPPGFANGHYAMTDCIFHYNLFYEGDYVDEKNQGVVKWNDPRFHMEWPTTTPILQGRDK